MYETNDIGKYVQVRSQLILLAIISSAFFVFSLYMQDYKMHTA